MNYKRVNKLHEHYNRIYTHIILSSLDLRYRDYLQNNYLTWYYNTRCSILDHLEHNIYAERKIKTSV